MEKHEIRGDDETPVPAPAPGAAADGILLVRAMQQQNEHEGGRLRLQVQAQAAVEEGGAGGGGVGAALHQFIDFGDRRLQAASFFLVWGCCLLINSTVMNPAANMEHKLLGFVVLITGAWLAILTLAGAGAGRAAARAERFLRGFFF